MGTISVFRHLKVNLTAKLIYICYLFYPKVEQNN
jgi:hypothetical protein